jgi:hypothetical protein
MMGSWVRAPVGSQNGRDVAVQRLYLFSATWRNGRLASLRGWCSQGRVGSNPTVVTNLVINNYLYKVNDSIAQLVEHITFNDGVLGSSPSRVTNFVTNTYLYKINDSIAQLVEHITFNDGVLGSSPSRVTKGQVIYYLTFYFFKTTGETGDLEIILDHAQKLDQSQNLWEVKIRHKY